MADLSPHRPEISFVHTFLCSAFAACFAEFCTIPLDTAKVRLQLEKKAVVGDVVRAPKYKGLLGTMATIIREEGLAALWNGIVPGLQRQCIYGGLRIGLYDPVKLFLVGSGLVGEIPLYYKVLAALLTETLIPPPLSAKLQLLRFDRRASLVRAFFYSNTSLLIDVAKTRSSRRRTPSSDGKSARLRSGSEPGFDFRSEAR